MPRAAKCNHEVVNAVCRLCGEKMPLCPNCKSKEFCFLWDGHLCKHCDYSTGFPLDADE
jgi:hypothetical protein